MKKLALFDIDNTLYQGLSIVDIAEQQAADALLPAATYQKIVKLVTEYRQGVRPYEITVRLLLESWVVGLAGKQYSAAEATARKVFQRPAALFGFASPLLAELRKTHALYFITGSPDFTAEACAEVLKVDGYRASEFEVADGIFTGQLGGILADRKEKLAAISELLSQYGKAGSLAFGDSEGDIAMLEAVESPFAVNATEGLQKYASERSWNLVSPDTIQESVQAAIHQR